MIYKRDPAQAFWSWATTGLRDPTLWPLQRLADGASQVAVTPAEEARVYAFLHDGLGMQDDDTPNVRTPIASVPAVR